MPAPSAPTALIVGASRGLGLGLAREYLRLGWRVIATERGAAPSALHDLVADGRLTILSLDMDRPDQVDRLRAALADEVLDLLFVVAGVAALPVTTIGEVSTEEFIRVMITNALSPMRLIERIEGRVKPDGIIAVMSSGLASIADNRSGGLEVYRGSKAALNMLLRSYAVRRPGRTFLALAPGWVRTDMGGPEAPLEVEESVRGLAQVIESRRGHGGIEYLNYKGDTLPW